MTKLSELSSQAIDRLTGYLAAAQSVFRRPQVDVTLEASFLEIVDRTTTNLEVLNAIYGPNADFNGIKLERECSLEEMTAAVHEILTIPRGMWHSNSQGIPKIIEEELRTGFWQHLRECFDYENARIIEIGHDVPCINILGGFTYILYSKDMTRCALLVGNTTD